MWNRLKRWLHRRHLTEIAESDADVAQRKRIAELIGWKETKQDCGSDDNCRRKSKTKSGFFRFSAGGIGNVRTGAAISRRQKVSSCEEGSVQSIRFYPGDKASRTELEEERPDVVGSVGKHRDQTRRRSLLTSGEVWVHAPQEQSDVEKVPRKTSRTESEDDLSSYPPLMRRRQKHSLRLGIEPSRKRIYTKQDGRNLKLRPANLGTDDFGGTDSGTSETEYWRGEDSGRYPVESESGGGQRIENFYPSSYDTQKWSQTTMDAGRTSVCCMKETPDLNSRRERSAAFERGYVTLKDLETQLASNMAAHEVSVGVITIEEAHKTKMVSSTPAETPEVHGDRELRRSEKNSEASLSPTYSNLSLLDDATRVRVTLSLTLDNGIRCRQDLKSLPLAHLECARIPRIPVNAAVQKGCLQSPLSSARTLSVTISELGARFRPQRSCLKSDFSLDRILFLPDVGEQKRRSSSAPERMRLSTALHGTLQIQILDKKLDTALGTSTETIRRICDITMEPAPVKFASFGSEKSVSRPSSTELDEMALRRHWKSECHSLETKGGKIYIIGDCIAAQKSTEVCQRNHRCSLQCPAEKNFQSDRYCDDTHEFKKGVHCHCSKHLRSKGEQFSYKEEPGRGLQFQCSQKAGVEIHPKQDASCNCYQEFHTGMRCQCDDHLRADVPSQSEHSIPTDTKHSHELDKGVPYHVQQITPQCHCDTNHRCQWRPSLGLGAQDKSQRDQQRKRMHRGPHETNPKSLNDSDVSENLKTDDSSASGIIWTVCEDCRHRESTDEGLETDARLRAFQLCASESWTKKTLEDERKRYQRFSGPSSLTCTTNCSTFPDAMTGADGTLSDFGEWSSSRRSLRFNNGETNQRRPGTLGRVARALSGSPPDERTRRSTGRALSNWTNTIPLRKRLAGKVFGQWYPSGTMAAGHPSNTCITQPVKLCRERYQETCHGSAISVDYPVNRGCRDFGTSCNTTPVNVYTNGQVARGHCSCQGNFSSVLYNGLPSNGGESEFCVGLLYCIFVSLLQNNGVKKINFNLIFSPVSDRV